MIFITCPRKAHSIQKHLRVQYKQRSRWKFSCFYLTQSKNSLNDIGKIFVNLRLYTWVLSLDCLSLVLHNPKFGTWLTTSIMLVSRHLTFMIVRKINFHPRWILLLSTIWIQETFDLIRNFFQLLIEITDIQLFRKDWFMDLNYPHFPNIYT